MAVLTAVTKSNKKSYTLISSAHAITDSYTVIGTAQIPVEQARWAVLEMSVTHGTSTGIKFKIFGGQTSAGSYTTEMGIKEVATGAVTWSLLENVIPGSSPDVFYDFEISRAAEYLEVAIIDAADGTGTVTKAILHLIY